MAGCRLSIAIAVSMVALLAGPVAAQNPAVDLSAVAQRAEVEPHAIVFGGDREFPPYEYLDERGEPQGFNIELIRALAREAGLAVEIRLGIREERMAEFDAGKADVMFLSYSEERAARYQLLDQTWTLSQVIVMRPGLPRYPRGLDDLWGVRVAVDNGSINHLLLSRLPEARRPALVVTTTRGEAIGAFRRGEVDGVAGNHLTLRFMMGELADGTTDRVNAQTELRSERDFVSAILDMAPLLVTVMDQDSRLVRFNRACEVLTGMAADQVLGKRFWELPFLMEEDRVGMRERIAGYAESAETTTIDRVWIDHTGARRMIEWAVAPLRNRDGQSAFVIAIGTDVTTTRELERLKSQFVSMVSHELRTPLTSIRASMQLLVAEAMTGSEDADQLVRVALANANRLIRIVNDILNMSKIEAGEMMVAIKRTPLSAILEDSVRTVEGFARNTGLTISAPAGGTAEVLADPDRTVQILVNLLSNAIKHAPVGTTVEVSVEREDGMMAVAIRDHGPGIPAHKVNAIFEPFTQLDGSDTRRIAGTGLGLTIARALAEKQGGTIRVASHEGEGATLTLTIPLA